MLMRTSFYAVMLTTLVGGSAWAFADEPPKKEGGPRPEGFRAEEPRREGGEPRDPLPPRREEGKGDAGPRGPQGFREGQGPEVRRPPEGNQPPRGEGFRGNPDAQFQGVIPPNGNQPGGRPQGFGPGQMQGPGPNQGPMQGMGQPGPRGPNVNPQDLERLKESDPEMYPFVKDDLDLEKQSFELSEQIRRTNDSEEKERLKNELINVVENHFNVRQERREMELKRLEEQIERMREALTKRADSRDLLIKQRIAELTGERDNSF